MIDLGAPSIGNKNIEANQKYQTGSDFFSNAPQGGIGAIHGNEQAIQPMFGGHSNPFADDTNNDVRNADPNNIELAFDKDDAAEQDGKLWYS